MHALLGKLEVSGGRPGPNAEVTMRSMEALRGLHIALSLLGLDADCGFPGTMQREEFDLMRFAPRQAIETRDAIVVVFSLIGFWQQEIS